MIGRWLVGRVGVGLVGVLVFVEVPGPGEYLLPPPPGELLLAEPVLLPVITLRFHVGLYKLQFRVYSDDIVL